MTENALLLKPSSKVMELINILADKIKEMEPGSVLSHLYLSSEIGVPYRAGQGTNNNYFSWVTKLKHKLIDEHGIFLTSVSGVGYKITDPGDEYEVCKKKISSGIRQVGRGAAESQKIRLEKIEDEQKRNNTISQVQKFANLVGLLGKNRIQAGV
jgi:hypothetical protein